MEIDFGNQISIYQTLPSIHDIYGEPIELCLADYSIEFETFPDILVVSDDEIILSVTNT